MPDSSSANVICIPKDCAQQEACELPSLVDARALAAGVQDLLGLLVASCGGSRRKAAELLGRDPRTFDRKHDMPSLTFLADLACALRMEVATAAAVVVGARRSRQRWAPSIEAMSNADFADDFVMLDELAETFRGGTCCPTVVQLAQAVCARAAQIQGDSNAALLMLCRLAWDDCAPHRSRKCEPNSCGRGLLAKFAATAACELCVSYALHHDQSRLRIARAAATRWLAHVRGAALSSDDVASQFRMEAQHAALDVVATLESGCETRARLAVLQARAQKAFHALDTLLDRCERLDLSDRHAAYARIWSASLAGEAACCALFHFGDRCESARTAIRLVVRASFILDEEVERHCAASTLDAASRVACARRARLMEREALVRARCDTKSNPSNEIKNFTQTLHCSLDALSS